jgi:hypothetical protein
MKKYELNPGDVNVHVISIIHKQWDLLAEQYLLYDRMNEFNWTSSRPGARLSRRNSDCFTLTFVSCTYYVAELSNQLTIYLVGEHNGQMQGYAFFNGVLERPKIDFWAHSNMLYDLKRVYSLVKRSSHLCSTSVPKPNEHDRAASILAVDLIRKWRLE